jgi:DNA-binding NarL/FixJ family response regulator
VAHEWQTAVVSEWSGRVIASGHDAMIAAETLSPREKDVLASAAEDCSNKAIAETLFVSPNTIKTHVASLLNKLLAETRVQLAVMAARTAIR